MLGEWEAAWVAANLLVIVGLLVFTRLRPWKIFAASAGLLYLLDILTLTEVSQGFTNPSLLVLLMLMLASLPLERTALMRKMTETVTGGSHQAMVLKLSVFSGLFSALVNNTAVVAAMLGPLKNQSRVPVSRLLLPLSYASILGGTLTLVGTSTNLIVNGFVQQAGYPSLGFFDFTLIGVPVFIACVAVMLLISHWLPNRNGNTQVISKEYFLERRVAEGSTLAGKTVLDNGLRHLERVFLIEIIRDQQVMAPVSPHEHIHTGDILVFSGDLSGMGIVDSFHGLELVDEVGDNVRENLVEAIVSPTASLVGETIRDVDFRARFDAAVVAVRRGDQRLKGGLGGLRLRAGDALVLAAGDDFGRRRSLRADFIVVGDVASNRLLGRQQGIGVLAGFFLVIALGALGVLPLLKGLVIYLGAVLLSRVLSLDEVKARFPFELLMVIGGALGLSQAMVNTGLAAQIGSWAGVHLAHAGLVGSLVGVFVLTWMLTEAMTNNAAAALMLPLSLAIGSQWPEAYQAFVMAVAFGASASFLSPYGYQTNLMVFTAGNYRLLDYLRFGLPVLVAYMAVALSAIYLFFL